MVTDDCNKILYKTQEIQSALSVANEAIKSVNACGAMTAIKQATDLYANAAASVTAVSDSIVQTANAMSSIFSCTDSEGFIGSATSLCSSIAKPVIDKGTLIGSATSATQSLCKSDSAISKCRSHSVIDEVLAETEACDDVFFDTDSIGNAIGLTQQSVLDSVHQMADDVTASLSTMQEIHEAFASVVKLRFSDNDGIHHILDNIARANRILQSIAPDLYYSRVLYTEKFNDATADMTREMHCTLHELYHWIIHTISKSANHYNYKKVKKIRSTTVIHEKPVNDSVCYKNQSAAFVDYSPGLREAVLPRKHTVTNTSDDSASYFRILVA